MPRQFLELAPTPPKSVLVDRATMHTHLVTVHLLRVLQVTLFLLVELVSVTVVSGLRIIHSCMSYCRFFFIICMHN